MYYSYSTSQHVYAEQLIAAHVDASAGDEYIYNTEVMYTKLSKFMPFVHCNLWLKTSRASFSVFCENQSDCHYQLHVPFLTAASSPSHGLILYLYYFTLTVILIYLSI